MTSDSRKQPLRDELIRQLEADLEGAMRAHQSAREGATHTEAKAEGDKDTRALEQSYIARGQALRVDELRTAIAEVRAMPLRRFAETDPVALGALVSVEDGDGEQRRTFFVSLHGGGAVLADGSVVVVTPKSPLGRALLGKRVGDDCEAMLAGRSRELTVLQVA